MTSSHSLAIIVITLGASCAIVLFIFLILCCKFTSNLRKKQRRTGGLCHRTIIFEQQTTTSDDNNAELFSCCLDESTSMVHPERESDPISSSYATGDFDDDHAHHLKTLGSTVATVAGSTVGQINSRSNSIKQPSSQSTQVTMGTTCDAVISFTPLTTTHQPSPVKMPHAINVLYMESSASASSAQGDTSEGEVSLKSNQPQPLPVDTIDSGKLLRKMDQMNEMCQKSTPIVSSCVDPPVINDDTSNSDVTNIIDKSIHLPLDSLSKTRDNQTVDTGDCEDEECLQSAGETITSVTTMSDQSASVPLTQSTVPSGSRLSVKSDKGKRFTRCLNNNISSSTTGGTVENIKCINILPRGSSKDAWRDAKINPSEIQCIAQCYDKSSSSQAQTIKSPHNLVAGSSSSIIASHSLVKLQASAAKRSGESGKSDLENVTSSCNLNIKRQESVDLPDDQFHRSLKAICVKDSSVESSGSERSPETIRKQYKELWQLRAEFHAEELAKERAKAAAAAALATDQQSKSSPSSSSSAGSVVLSSSSSIDARSSIDPGYKLVEGRKDYSIDHKSETIYRQFTSAEGIGVKVASAHPSIEEEEEEEEEEVIFV